jgi:hypothetical protein
VRPVDPSAEGLVLVLQGDRGEQEVALLGSGPQQACGELGGVVGLAGDDPEVVFAAEGLALDHFAGEAVAEQAGGLLDGRQAAAHGEFAQFRGACRRSRESTQLGTRKRTQLAGPRSTGAIR